MEALGTVAATLQLAEVALKLKKLYSDIRNAPADLSSLVEEVAVLADVLADVGHQPQPASTLDDRAWKRCYSLLKDSTEKLRSLTAGLEAALQSHRRTGAIRLYLKKDELSRYKERLERVKSTMTIAQQAYYFAILGQKNELVLQEIRALAVIQQAHANMTLSAITTSSLTAATRTTDTERRQICNTSNEKATTYNSHARLYQARRKSRYNLHLPAWILRKGLQILIDRDSHSWGLRFRYYNHLPPDSELFRAARSNQWLHVRDLFANAQASPFDLNHCGETLLHIAARAGNLDACRFLLDYGLDPLQVCEQWDDRTPATDLLITSPFAEHTTQPGSSIYRQNLVEVFSVMLSHPAVWFSIEDLTFRSCCMLAPPATLQFVIRLVVPPYSNTSPSRRARLAMLAGHPDSISILLGPNLSMHQAFSLLQMEESTENHRSLVGTAAAILSRCFSQPEHCQHEIEGWRYVLRNVVEFESQVRGALHYYPSILVFVYFCAHHDFNRRKRSIPSNWNEYFTKTGRLWLQFLIENGVDLARYGEAEKAASLGLSDRRSGFTLPIFKTNRKSKTCCFELQNIVFGPEIDDWKLYFLPLDPKTRCRGEYEMAWEFWEWIENPELYGIPGSYLPDEQSPIPIDLYHVPKIEAPVF